MNTKDTTKSRIVHSKKRRRTLIIGAGIAGLTLAALMRQRGEAPVVIEREKHFDHLGYMLGLYYLGSRVFHGLGLFDRYVAESVEMKTYNIYSTSGWLLKSLDLSELGHRFGPIQGISRAVLIHLLLEGTRGLEIRMDCRAKAIHQSHDTATVTFTDGESEEFETVVAADGMHSDTRKLLWKANEWAYRETGWGGWVVWCDPSSARSNSYTEYWGADRFLGIYPVKDGVGLFGGGPVTELKALGHAEFARDFQARFDRTDELIAPCLSSLKNAEDPFFWNFHDCRAECWSKNRVVLLGDSATGFLPTAGIGASMAMESAAALNDVLSRADAARFPQALRLYEKRRKRRVEAAQTNSRRLGRFMFVKSAPLAWLRDRVVQFYSLKRMIKSIADLMDEPV